MSENTRGLENSGSENVEQSLNQYLQRGQNGGMPEGFEGMNYEQNRSDYRYDSGKERKTNKSGDDPTYR